MAALARFQCGPAPPEYGGGPNRESCVDDPDGERVEGTLQGGRKYQAEQCGSGDAAEHMVKDSSRLRSSPATPELPEWARVQPRRKQASP
jgi:hypothetical protein